MSRVDPVAHGAVRPLKIGDEFAVEHGAPDAALPVLPLGLNWARKGVRGDLVVYEVVKRGNAIQVSHENGPAEQIKAYLDDRAQTLLTTNKEARKNTPVFSGVLRYFPRALAAVAALSQIGNEQHNPGTPLHWDRAKSGDELNALTRHLLEAGACDTDGVRHSTKVAWRALANLEKELEQADVQPRTVHTPRPDELGPGY